MTEVIIHCNNGRITIPKTNKVYDLIFDKFNKIRVSSSKEEVKFLFTGTEYTHFVLSVNFLVNVGKLISRFSWLNNSVYKKYSKSVLNYVERSKNKEGVYPSLNKFFTFLPFMFKLEPTFLLYYPMKILNMKDKAEKVAKNPFKYCSFNAVKNLSPPTTNRFQLFLSEYNTRWNIHVSTSGCSTYFQHMICLIEQGNEGAFLESIPEYTGSTTLYCLIIAYAASLNRKKIVKKHIRNFEDRSLSIIILFIVSGVLISGRKEDVKSYSKYYERGEKDIDKELDHRINYSLFSEF